MNLFKSRFAALESFAKTEADKRTPEMLAAAQAELDTATAGVILVPKADGLQSAADLQNHIDKLETDARAATAAAETAQRALTALKGQRVLDDPKHTSDKGTSGDHNKQEESAELKAARARSSEKSYNKRVQNLLNAE